MTIIDNEGRLFSKINLLDAIIILFLCLILVWVGVKVAHRYTTVKEYDHYLIKVKAPNLEETIAQSIKKDDIITTPNGAYFGLILDEPQITPTSVYVTTPEGVLVSRTQPKLKDATFTLQVRVPKGSAVIRYGNQTMKSGATGFIETARTKYTILVLSIEAIHDLPEQAPEKETETSTTTQP
jgi:hypothetical protein